MAGVRKLLIREHGVADPILRTSNSDLVAADVTTDNDFTETLGRKADAAAAGAVTATDSMVGYLKQLVTLLLGTGYGLLSVLQKATTITPTTGGVDLTGVATGGAIFVKSVSVQKITDNEANGVTSVVVISDDTVPLNARIEDESGNAVIQADLVSGRRFTQAVGWKLASGKKLRVKTTGASGTAGYLWTVEAYPLAEGATIAIG